MVCCRHCDMRSGTELARAWAVVAGRPPQFGRGSRYVGDARRTCQESLSRVPRVDFVCVAVQLHGKSNIRRLGRHRLCSDRPLPTFLQRGFVPTYSRRAQAHDRSRGKDDTDARCPDTAYTVASSDHEACWPDTAAHFDTLSQLRQARRAQAGRGRFSAAEHRRHHAPRQ